MPRLVYEGHHNASLPPLAGRSGDGPMTTLVPRNHRLYHENG